MNIGAHVSIAGGIQKAPERAQSLGCEIMQIFTRSPQGGPTPELTSKIIMQFRANLKKYQIKKFYIHAPYYINLASKNNRVRYGSSKAIREELERGSLLGATYVMTHLGSTKNMDEEYALKKTIEMLKKTLAEYSGSTKLLLENSAGAGAIIGDDLKELAEIIQAVNSNFIAGICLDTQHSFVSGYDWRASDAVFKKINTEIGLDRIKLFHCNDSQSDFNSHKDRHAHIGQGKIGLNSFKNILKFAEKNNIDLICETEWPKTREDIGLLKLMRAKK